MAVPNDDYCKLSYYLHSVLRECGVDVLQDTMLDYVNFASQPADKKEALLTLASGKTCCLETLSYKTIFLDSQNGTTLLPASNDNIAKNTYLSLDKATSLLDIDTLLFGGMMQVTPSRVMICNEQWVREYYLKPLRRLKGKDNSTANSAISNDEIAALFVRSNAEEERASGMLGMMEKMQQMMQQQQTSAKEVEENQYQSFSGEGKSLGSATCATEGRFDPTTLPESLPPVDDSQPTTSIAVRLLNGKRQVVKLNLTNTVGDLAAHLKDSVGGQAFRIAGGFPPKPLTDPSASVEDAGLKGAQVSLQKTE